MAFERIKIVKGHPYKVLVENKWDPEKKKVVQKTLKHLGRADRPIPPAPLLQTTGTYSAAGGYIFVGKNKELLEQGKKYKIEVYLL